MTLKLNERYPGRFNNPSADYPQGSFKNRTSPTAKDGSYLEKDWANDKEGFFQSIIAAAAITPSGAVDKVGASQLYDALLKTILSTSVGRLIGARVITATTTYTKTPGTNSVIVEVIGAGGGSGSCQGTGASAVSVSGAGGGGGYAASRLTSGFDGLLVTIGAGGTGGTGGANNAGAGLITSFGALLQANGGGAGQGNATSVTTTASQMVTSGFGGSASGGNLINSTGQRGVPGIIINSDLNSGSGGLSGRGTASGADGKQNGTNQSNQAGAAGQPGKVIIWEYA